MAVTPNFSKFFVNGKAIRSNAGETIRISNSIFSCVELFVNFPSLTSHPASFNKRKAVRICVRILPDPSVLSALFALPSASGNINVSLLPTVAGAFKPI